MTTSGDTIDLVDGSEPIQETPGSDRRFSPRLRWIAIVTIMLSLGLVARSLVSGGISNSFIADLLPWLNGTSVTLFFGEGDADYLVPVSRTLTGDAESPEALVDALFAGPDAGTGLLTLMPEGAAVLSVREEGAIAVIDLSAEYAIGRTPLADEALVHTLGSWPTIDVVRVTVEGVPLSSMAPSDHLLYFYDADRDMLIAEPLAGADTVAAVLTAYLEGPSRGGLVGVPADVEVLVLESAPDSGLLKLNMTYTSSVRDLALNDGDAMRRVLEGLLATLTTGFPDTQYVYLDFEGHATLGLGQCANLLRRVQPPPSVLNDERLLVAGAQR